MASVGVGEGQEKSYHCHSCEIQFTSRVAKCSQCDGEFVEEIEDQPHTSDPPPVSDSTTNTTTTSSDQRRRPRERDRLGELLGQYLLQLITAREQLEDSENYTLPVIPPPPQFLEMLFRSRNRPFPSATTSSSGNNLDSVIARLLERLSESEGPPPADKTKIDSLPSFTITQTHIDKDSECSICKDSFSIGEECLSLPCTHFFHNHCIGAWLKIRGTCPTCRFSLNEGKVVTD